MHRVKKNYKLISVFLIVGFVVGGILFGWSRIFQQTAKEMLSQKNVLGKSIQPSTSTVTATPSPIPMHTIHGGVAAIQSYTATISASWEITAEHDEQDGIDRAIFKKGDYQLSIYQSSGAYSTCLGATTPTTQNQFFFNGMQAAQYERVQLVSAPSDQWITFSVCQMTHHTHYPNAKTTGTGTYISPTTFGKIDYIVPVHYDAQILSEMDAIVASLEKN